MSMPSFDPLWLPQGHHYSLHIEHRPLNNAGFIGTGGRKLVWHTTESDWDSTEIISDLFANREAAGQGSHPTLMIGAGVGAKKHPSVVQFVALNRAGKALKHPTGTSETNRANCVQIEVCGRAAESGDWPESRYKALANLILLINHRRPISSNVPRPFTSSLRFTSGGFVAARGHVGHRHVPFNDHTDPGSKFDIRLLLRFLVDAPHAL